MFKSKFVKIVVFVPEKNADSVREAMGQAGAGQIGNYKYCSFSSKGTGRFIPQDGAKPAIGQIGALESVVEERIEALCEKNCLKEVIEAIHAVHPYEEVAMDIYPLEDFT